MTSLKAWNSQKGGKWEVPKKGSDGYNQVRDLMGQAGSGQLVSTLKKKSQEKKQRKAIKTNNKRMADLHRSDQVKDSKEASTESTELLSGQGIKKNSRKVKGNEVINGGMLPARPVRRQQRRRPVERDDDADPTPRQNARRQLVFPVVPIVPLVQPVIQGPPPSDDDNADQVGGCIKDCKKMEVIDRLETIESEIRAIREVLQGQDGEGLKELIEKGVSLVKNTWDALANGLRKDFPPSVRTLLIVGIMVQRKPIDKAFKDILNFFTAGKLTRTMKDMSYDDLYHLSLILKMEDGTMLNYEKNEVMSMKVVGQTEGEILNVPMKAPILLNEFIGKTLAKISKENFFLYMSGVCIWSPLA